MIYTDKLSIGSERKYTDEGFLRVPAKISRSGTQDYLASEMGLHDRDPSEIVTIYRPEDEVFSKDSMGSFSSKPVTDGHPPELVNSINAKEFVVGMAEPSITRDGNFVSATLNITDAAAIKNIEDGKVELSNGYTADIDWTSGSTSDGIKFDAIQRNIRGNHIAIVTKGRAGSDCRVADVSPQPNKNNMSKILIDEVDYEVNDQAAQAVKKLQKNLFDAEEEIKSKEKDLEEKDEEMEEAEKKAKKTEDSLNAKIDDLKSKAPSSEQLDKMVSDRAAFVDSVRKIAPEIKWEGKDEATIRKEVVASKCSETTMDGKSEEYIKARFDMLFEQPVNSQQALDDALKTTVNNDGKKEIVDNRPADVIAREKFTQDSRKAWQGDNK